MSLGLLKKGTCVPIQLHNDLIQSLKGEIKGHTKSLRVATSRARSNRVPGMSPHKNVKSYHKTKMYRLWSRQGASGTNWSINHG